MKTTVIHIKSAPAQFQTNPKYVYIGRAREGFESKYGNPHPVGFPCKTCKTTHERGAGVVAFKKDFDRLIADEWYREKIEALRGKVLVCFCKPNACHGDVYAEYLNKEET